MESQKKSNPWLVHVAKFRKDNPSLSYKDVLKQAKESYTKKVSGSAISGGAKEKKDKKPRAKKEKAGSIVGGSVSGGSVSGGAKKPEKKARKPRKDKGTKKGGKMILGKDGAGQQKIPVEHVTTDLVKVV